LSPAGQAVWFRKSPTGSVAASSIWANTWTSPCRFRLSRRKRMFQRLIIFRFLNGRSEARRWAFFIRLRMDHARQLLDSTSSSIKEIAALVGYNDQFYFSRVFKSVHRMAPTEYRRRNGKPAVGGPQSNGRTVKPLSIFKVGAVDHEDRALSPNHLSQNNHR